MKQLSKSKISILLNNRSIASLTGLFAGGNLISLILRMLGGILTARVVTPSVLGLFNGLGLVLSYAPLLQLGILNGLSRELPFLIGKGDGKTAQELAAAAQIWALVVGGTVSLILGGLSVWFIIQHKWELAAGWITYAFGAMALFYGHYYLQITYRTRGDFAKLALFNMITNIIGILSILFVWKYGFYGLCIRYLVIGIIDLGLLWYWRPIKVKPSFNWIHIKHLLKIGAPIFVVGQIYLWWIALDSTLVLRFMGSSGLGLYQLAIIVSSAIAVLPSAVSGITYPKMAEEFGSTNKIENLIHIVRKPIIYMTLGIIPAVFLAWKSLPYLTLFLMPKYANGINAAQWTLLVAALLCLTPINSAFNVVKRQDLYGFAMIIGLVAYLGSLFYLIRGKPYLAAFPQAMAIGQSIFIGFCYLFLAYLKGKERAISK